MSPSYGSDPLLRRGAARGCLWTIPPSGCRRRNSIDRWRQGARLSQCPHGWSPVWRQRRPSSRRWCRTHTRAVHLRCRIRKCASSPRPSCATRPCMRWWGDRAAAQRPDRSSTRGSCRCRSGPTLPVQRRAFRAHIRLAFSLSAPGGILDLVCRSMRAHRGGSVPIPLTVRGPGDCAASTRTPFDRMAKIATTTPSPPDVSAPQLRHRAQMSDAAIDHYGTVDCRHLTDRRRSSDSMVTRIAAFVMALERTLLTRTITSGSWRTDLMT